MTYEKQRFDLPELNGISTKLLDIHLELYAGYVKTTNQMCDVLAELRKDPEKNALALGEVMRRFPFEFDGMRMHEYYFEQWETGPKLLDESTTLAQTLAEEYGSMREFETRWKSIGLLRGIGWTVLGWDPKGGKPLVYWVGEHEVGQLAGLPVVLVMDMWEHAFLIDYKPADKKKYVEAFWLNLNWDVLEKRFTEVADTAALGRGAGKR